MRYPVFKGESKSRQPENRTVQLFLTRSDLNYPKGINVNNIIHILCLDFSRQLKATFWTQFLSKHFICLCIFMSIYVLLVFLSSVNFNFHFSELMGQMIFFYLIYISNEKRLVQKSQGATDLGVFFHIVYSKSNYKLSN